LDKNNLPADIGSLFPAYCICMLGISASFSQAMKQNNSSNPFKKKHAPQLPIPAQQIPLNPYHP
jgi:hypothetical protein